MAKLFNSTSGIHSVETGAYTVPAGRHNHLIRVEDGGGTITLPDLASSRGAVVLVDNAKSAGVVLVSRAGSDTVESATGALVGFGDGAEFYAPPSGTDWKRTTIRKRRNYVELIDEFIGGNAGGNNAANAIYGELGWGYGGAMGATPGYEVGEAGHPGIWQVRGDGDNTSVGYGFLSGQASSVRAVTFSDFREMELIFRVKETLATDQRFRVGMWNNTSEDATVIHGVWVEFLKGTDTYLMGCHTNGSAAITRSSLAVAHAAATWHKVLIVKNVSGNYEFYVNGALSPAYTASSNIPDSADYSQIGVQTLGVAGGSDFNFNLDYFRFRLGASR